MIQIAMRVENWTIEQETGYKPKTTFYTDFSIAEKFGDKGIKETYETSFSEWKDNVEYMTELTMVLNWKCWRWWEENRNRGELYKELYKRADEWCYNHFTGEDLNYYLQTTD